jgi:hypothetical protein
MRLCVFRGHGVIVAGNNTPSKSTNENLRSWRDSDWRLPTVAALSFLNYALLLSYGVPFAIASDAIQLVMCCGYPIVSSVLRALCERYESRRYVFVLMVGAVCAVVMYLVV